MKLKAFLLFLLPLAGMAQQKLSFDHVYFACEDKWVVFPKKDTDSSYMFGFIYLDEQAGFTVDVGGSFTINDQGNYVKTLKDSASVNSIKIRLTPRTVDVAILENDRLEQLNLPVEPEWLKHYKKTDNLVQSLLRRGYMYNHVGGSTYAIPLLEKAYAEKPHADGLEFELAYAYNATKDYKSAINVLKEAIAYNPQNFFFYRELGFAYVYSGKIEEAEPIYRKGIELADDKDQRAEMAINMVQGYDRINNPEKFKEWVKITRQYADKDSPIGKYLKSLEDNRKKR